MKLAIWDFDGTLGYREGGWSGTLSEIAGQHQFTRLSLKDIRRQLSAGFPWHSPEREHPNLNTPKAWWAALEPVFVRAFTAAGVPAALADSFAKQVPEQYRCMQRWHLYPDTLQTLNCLKSLGWTHVVLSNHVPELDQILCGLSVRECFAAVFSSARTGYEKPNRRAYECVVSSFEFTRHVWMIGDNVDTDVKGAESFGIRAILVRTLSKDCTFQSTNLTGVIDILEEPRSV